MLENLSQEELEVIHFLSRAWETYQKLPELYVNQRLQFMFKINELQNMMLSRPIYEEMKLEAESKHAP